MYLQLMHAAWRQERGAATGSVNLTAARTSQDDSLGHGADGYYAMQDDASNSGCACPLIFLTTMPLVRCTEGIVLVERVHPREALAGC